MLWGVARGSQETRGAEGAGERSDSCTQRIWINGNENVLPQNTTILEAYDSSNYRTLNIHFPWSNGRMYWDCGNSGTSSYDRIDKAASLNEYTDEWSHWAFTKNATTGDLKIYRNGILWHSGTGYSRTIDIATLKLASNGNGNGYFWDGHIKELRVFDKELSMTTINDWMIKRIDNSHPDYSNLVAHYPLNEGQGITSLDMLKLHNSVCDYFIICHGNSNTQVDAISDSIEEQVRKETGEKPWQMEGSGNSEWILMDYVDVVVHIFQKETRLLLLKHTVFVL